jgi:hypothetical protein
MVCELGWRATRFLAHCRSRRSHLSNQQKAPTTLFAGANSKKPVKTAASGRGILERTRHEENTAGVSDDGDDKEKFQKSGHHNAPFPTALPAAQLENAGPHQTVPFFLTDRRAPTGKDGAPWPSNSWRSQVKDPHQVETKRSVERKASPCPEPPPRAWLQAAA